MNEQAKGQICDCPLQFLMHLFTLEGDSAHSDCVAQVKSPDGGDL